MLELRGGSFPGLPPYLGHVHYLLTQGTLAHRPGRQLGKTVGHRLGLGLCDRERNRRPWAECSVRRGSLGCFLGVEAIAGDQLVEALPPVGDRLGTKGACSEEDKPE